MLEQKRYFIKFVNYDEDDYNYGEEFTDEKEIIDEKIFDDLEKAKQYANEELYACGYKYYVIYYFFDENKDDYDEECVEYRKKAKREDSKKRVEKMYNYLQKIR